MSIGDEKKNAAMVQCQGTYPGPELLLLCALCWNEPERNGCEYSGTSLRSKDQNM